jgi:hypothetical protein
MTITYKWKLQRFFQRASFKRTWPEGYWLSTTSESGNTTDWSGFWSYVTSVPNNLYKRLIALGLNATTGREGVKHSVSFTPYKVLYFYYQDSSKKVLLRNDICEGTGPLISGTQATSWFDGLNVLSLEDRVSNKAGASIRNNLRQAQSSFQSAVFVAELGKTSNMVLGLAHECLTAFKGYRKRAVSHITKRRQEGAFDEELLKDVTGMYLSTVYGILPTIADIDNGMRTIANIINKPLGIPVASTDQDTISSDIGTLNGVWNSFAPCAFKGGLQATCSVRCKAFLKFGDVTENAYISRSLGGDLYSFVPSLYELMPYSFLIDYFSNLGDVIGAASLGSVDLGWSYYTVRTTVSIKGGLEKTSSVPSHNEMFFEGGNFSISRTKFSRNSGLPDFNPFKAFQLEIPGVRQGINTMMLLLSKLT